MSHISDTQVINAPESFWQKGFATLRATAPAAIHISFLAFILPQIFHELIFAQQTSELVEISKSFAAGVGPRDFYNLLEPAANYASSFMAASALLWIIHITGYLGIVQICHCVAIGKDQPAIRAALANGLKLTLRRGLLTIVLFGVLFVVVQVLLPPAVLALLPGLMIPVLLVTGTKGVVQPIVQAIKMSYGERFPGGKWPLFFQLMSLGAFFYAGVLLVVFLSNQFLTIATWLNLPRELWNTSIGKLPISPMYALSLLFRLASLSFLTCLMAAISVTFFVWVKRLPPQGIVA